MTHTRTHCAWENLSIFNRTSI